ncbi:MAG: 3-hydroxyacyl-ACP dehydratase FabZ [Terriglobia bacterium]
MIQTTSEIAKILPHRYPFLLVDRVTAFEPGRRITGVKTFTAGEPFFAGHFAGAPIVPCAILLEMTTQLGAILVLERPGMAGKIALILQIPSAQMHAVAVAGDVLRVQAEVLKLRDHFGELEGRVFRGEELVAEGRMRFAITGVEALPIPARAASPPL